MENVISFFEKVICGIFWAAIYIGICFLAIYISNHFEWGSKPTSIIWCIITGFTLCFCYLKDDEGCGNFVSRIFTTIVVIIGVIEIICFWNKDFPLWTYILNNSLICLTIITTQFED